MQIPFDEVPFMLLSTREYQYHQGKSKSISKKKQTNKKKRTKKFDRFVRFQVKKIYRFWKFAIIKDTKNLRDVNSKVLKEDLDKLKLDKKTILEENFGNLDYICMSPLGMIEAYNHVCIIFKQPSSFNVRNFVERDIKMHSTVLSIHQSDFFMLSSVHGH